MISICGIDFLTPVFDCLISNNVTKADKTVGYLLDSIRIFIENLNYFPNYLHYLKNELNIDLQLEMLYRSIFEHCGVPEQFLSINEINNLFLKNNNQSSLFYIDMLKFAIFSENSVVMHQAKPIFTSSEFYQNSNKSINEKFARYAEDLIMKKLLISKSPDLNLGLLFDLYFRLIEYNFLREIFLKIISYQHENNPKAARTKPLFTELQKLMMYYVSQVDMNLAAVKSTSQTERYIRVLDLITQYVIDTNPFFAYSIADIIYKKIKISQFEKPFKRKVRSGSFRLKSKPTNDNELLNYKQIEELDTDFPDFKPNVEKRNSIIVSSVGLDVTSPDEPVKARIKKYRKYDILLSICLSKLIVIFASLKRRLEDISAVQSSIETDLHEEIFNLIDCSKLILEIYNCSSSEVLLDLSQNDFYNFLSYIKKNDGYEDESENEKLISIIEVIFSMMTSKSQINILESQFIEYMQFVPVENFKRLLLKINSPYFTISFIKEKLVNNIGTYENYSYSIDPLLELLYCFEDLLLKEFVESKNDEEHRCINQQTKPKHLFNESSNSSTGSEISEDIEDSVCIKCYKKNELIDMCEEALILFIMNLCNVDKLYLSYPFVRSEQINYQIFNDIKFNSINENSIQRNGGAFRIIISSILTLIDAKISKDSIAELMSVRSSFISDSTEMRLIGDLSKDRQFILLDLLLLLLKGCDDIYFFKKLFSNIFELAPIEESKMYISSIFSIDPKFTVENSCAELNSIFNRWNVLKTASTYLIHFNSHKKTEENDCIFQNCDFIIFYIINSLLNTLIQSKESKNKFKFDVWNCFRRVIQTSQKCYQSEGRNLVDVICQFLNLLIIKDNLQSSIDSKSCSSSSSDRISQEIKYEIEMKIEAEKSVDFETKLFSKFKQDIISEYTSVIDKVNQNNEYYINESTIDSIIDSLPENFEHDLQIIFNRCICKQIQNAIIQCNTIFERGSNNQSSKKFDMAEKAAPLNLQLQTLSFEESLHLEHHINNTLLSQIIVFEQNTKNKSCLAERAQK